MATADGSTARGRVVFRSGGTVLGTVVVSKGKAALRLRPGLQPRVHRLTATFTPSDQRTQRSSRRTVLVIRLI